MATSVGRGLRMKRVDDSLLQCGVAIMPGGVDQLGRPLVTFPTTTPDMLRQRHTTAHLVLLLRYYVTLTDMVTRHGGMAVIANLTTFSAKDALQMVVDSLDKLQAEICGSVGIMYAILPRSKDAQKSLKKLLGLKPSKKHPKMPTYEVILLEGVADLQRYIQRRHLTSDLGGTMTYNHRIWAQLTQDIEDLAEDVTSSLGRVPDALDKVTMMSEYDLPASPSEIEALLLQVRSKYNDVMCDLNLEHLIDECKSLNEKLSAPHKYEGYNDITQTVTFTEAKVKVIDYRNRLVKARESLKLLWQQAERRLTLSSKINKYKVKAEKVTEWMQGVGLPTVNQEPDIADCLSKAEILKNHFETGFLTIAQNVLWLAEKILKKFESVLQECSSPSKPSSSSQTSSQTTDRLQKAAVLAYTRQFQATVEYFKRAVEKKHQVYVNVHAFFLGAVKTSNVETETNLSIYRQLQQLTKWYRRTLSFLPVQLLVPVSQTSAGLPNRAAAYTSAAWRAAVEDFLLHHPLPPADKLSKMKNVIPVIDNIGIRNQARLLISRITVIRLLLVTPEHLTLHDLQDVLAWRDQVTKGQDEIYLNMTTSTLDLSHLTDVAYNNYSQKGNLSEREHQPHMESEVKSSSTSDNAIMRTPKLRLGNGNARVCFDEQLTDDIQSAHTRNGHHKEHQDSARQSEHNIAQAHRPPLVPKLDLRSIKSPVMQQSPFQRGQFLERQRSFGIYGDVDDPEKMAQRRRRLVCAIPHGAMAVDAGGGVAGAQQSITKELYDVAGPQQSVTKELYGVARARQLITKELCYVAGAQQSVTEETSGVAGVQQAVAKELYVSLGGTEASSGSSQLPVSLKHINLNALEKNLPQAKENVEHRTMQPTATSHNIEHRKERLHSSESLVDSGIANTQSSTEGSRVSDSTTGLSPNLSVGHGHANTLQQSNGRSPGRGHPEHRTQSRDPRVQGHEVTVIQERDHVVPDQCDLSMKHPNQIHRNHDNINKSGDQRQAQLLQAKSLPDLTYEQNGRLSLVQNNVDIIVNSVLSPEEKLKLMATMCECDSVHSGSNVSADPVSAPLLALANGSARLDDEAGLVHGRGSVSYNQAGRLSKVRLLNSSLTSLPGGGAANANEAGPVSSSPSHFPQTPKPTRAKLTSPEASPASLHPDQIAPSVMNPQGHQQNQQHQQHKHSIHHQGHMDPEQQQIAQRIRDCYDGKAADQVQIQNGRQPGPAEAFLLSQHAQGFGGGCEKGTAHAPGLGIDIEAWMMMNQEDGGRRLLLTEVSDREQAENGMAEYVEKLRHAQDSREAEEEDLVQARATLEDLRVQEEQFKQQVVEDSLTRTEQLLQEQEDHLRQQKKMILEPADDFLLTSECSLSSGTHTSDGYPLPRSPGSPPPHPDAPYRSSRSVSPPRAAVYDSSASAESGVFTLNSADWQLIKAARSEPDNCEEGSGAQPRARWLGCAAGSALMMTPDELLQGRAALSEKSGRVGAAAGQAAKSGVVRQMDFRDMIKSTRTGSDGKNDGDDEDDEGNEDGEDDEGIKDIMHNDGNEDIRGNGDIVDIDGNGDIEGIGDNEGIEDDEDDEGNEDAADIEGNENIEGDEDIDGDEDIKEEDDRQNHHHHDHHRGHYDGCDDHDDHEDESCEQLTASLQVKHADFHSPKQGLQDRCDESRGNFQVNGTADLGASPAEPNSLPSTASASPETIGSGYGSVLEKGGDVEVTGEGAVLPGEEGGECVPDGRDHKRHHHRHQHQHHHRQILGSGSSTPADSPSPPPSRTGSPGETPLQKWHSIDWSVMDDGSIAKPQKDVNENLTGWGCGLEEVGSVDGLVNENEKELIATEAEEEELVVPRTECATRTDAVHQAATSVARSFMRDVRDEEGGTVVHGCTELGDVKVKVAHGGGVSAWSKALPFPSYTMEFLNLKTPVIIDNGSGMCKCGFADQDRPSAIFPALVGRAKYEDVSVGRMEEHYVGLDAQSMRGVLKLHYPLEHGIITDWNDMELIWQHAFKEELRIDPAEHPVLVTEAPLNPKKNREHMMELLFETFQVPGVYFAVQAVLALYASGRTTGMVMDSGDGVSHFVPIYEGYSLPHAVQRLDLAGRDLTQYMATLFQEKGVSFTSSAEREILRDIKEQHCYVTQDYCADMQRAETSAAMEEFYTLPDGSAVSLTTERFRCPELLFDPTVIGHEPGGVHISSYKSIMKCDFDLRKQLFSNIVLSGGTTMLPGFGKRLQAEVSALAPSGVAGSVHVTSPDDRYFSVWQGGAVLASLPTFHDSWISYEEYLDVGSNIVHLKCF